MKIELDVHTHTVASGHAFSSMQEMAQAAAGKGLKLLGITEHSRVYGYMRSIYFRNLHVVPRQMYGIELCWEQKLIFSTAKVISIWMSFI